MSITLLAEGPLSQGAPLALTRPVLRGVVVGDGIAFDSGEYDEPVELSYVLFRDGHRIGDEHYVPVPADETRRFVLLETAVGARGIRQQISRQVGTSDAITVITPLSVQVIEHGAEVRSAVIARGTYSHPSGVIRQQLVYTVAGEVVGGNHLVKSGNVVVVSELVETTAAVSRLYPADAFTVPAVVLPTIEAPTITLQSQSGLTATYVVEWAVPGGGAVTTRTRTVTDGVAPVSMSGDGEVTFDKRASSGTVTATDVVSGPAGSASAQETAVLPALAAGPSLDSPQDIGLSALETPATYDLDQHRTGGIAPFSWETLSNDSAGRITRSGSVLTITQEDYTAAVQARVTDAAGRTADITVQVTVTTIDTSADSAETYVGAAPFALDVLDNDDGLDTIVGVTFDVGDDGTADVTHDGAVLTITPRGIAGTMSGTYSATGPGGATGDGTWTVEVYAALEDAGATDSSFDESDTAVAIDIFAIDDEDNLVLGGKPPFTVVKDSGDAALTIPTGATPAAQHQIVVDRATPGNYSITFTVTDALGQTLQLSHGVVVHALIAITAEGDKTIVRTNGYELYPYEIPEGEPRGPYTFTVDPAAIEGQAPSLLGIGAQKLVARGYLSDGTLISALFQSDVEATDYSFTRTWYDFDDAVIETATPLTVPSGAARVVETASDQYGSASSTAYVQVPLTVDSPQTWASSVNDPDTYDAAQHFGGGSGPKTYSVVSDTTESLSINPSTGQLTISGAGIGQAVIRATDSLTPTAQSEDLTLNIQRQAASTALAYPMLGQSNQIGKAPYDELGLHASSTFQWTSDDALAAVTGSMLDHKDGHVLTDMGPSITFSDEIRAATSTPIHFIPAAEGATGIGTGDWAQGGANYAYAVARMNAYTAATGNNFDAVVMNIGGRDARTGHEDTFAANAAQMMADMRADVDGIGPTTPFVWVEVLEVLAEDATINDQLALLVASEPYTALVPAADLDGISGDNIHFDAPSLRTLGERYYAGVAAAKANTPTAQEWNAPNVTVGDGQATYSSGGNAPTPPANAPNVTVGDGTATYSQGS